MYVPDDADNFARDDAVGRKAEREMPAQWIFVRKVAFGQRFADQCHRRRGKGIVVVEQTATKQRNAHHGEIARAGGDVIGGVGCPWLQRWMADNMKAEGDGAIHDGQWTGNSRILHSGLGLKTRD